MGHIHIQWNALIMEMLGVFALNYIGGTAILAGDKNDVAGPLAHGLALGIFIWIGASTSGANYNPAVTLALMLTKNLDCLNGLLYMCAQVIGSFLAYPLVMLADRSGDNLNGMATTYPHVILAVADDQWWWKANLLEFFATFFLVFIVFATAVDKRASPAVYGLAIGCTVTMSAFGIGNLTGAALNPTRWLGPATCSMTDDYWKGLCVYISGPLLGGLAAGPLYQHVLLEKN